MRYHQGFISNSSSCSFICNISPDKADKKLQEVLATYNEEKKKKSSKKIKELKFQKLFNPSFKIDQKFVDSYNKNFRGKEFYLEPNRTIIDCKLEDNEMDIDFLDMLMEHLYANYIRHDSPLLTLLGDIYYAYQTKIRK